jgi:hypothetical protein
VGRSLSPGRIRIRLSSTSPSDLRRTGNAEDYIQGQALVSAVLKLVILLSVLVKSYLISQLILNYYSNLGTVRGVVCCFMLRASGETDNSHTATIPGAGTTNIIYCQVMGGGVIPSTQRYYHSSFTMYYYFNCYMFRSYDHLQVNKYTIYLDLTHATGCKHPRLRL